MQTDLVSPPSEPPSPLAVEVRELDTGDDAVLQRWHEIYVAADTFERPWATVWSFEEAAVNARDEDETLRNVFVGAFDGAEMVGAGINQLPLLDNTDKVYGGVFVEPALRRRGVGSALVEHAVATTRAAGRSILLVEGGLPGTEREDHPYTRFALRHGFTMANVEVHRVLDLPLDTAEVEAMRAEAAPHYEGYEIRTFEDEIPDQLLPSYVELLNRLVLEAPTGEIDFEAEAVTPEVYRKQVKRMRAQGRHKLTTLAVSSEGEAVANTDLVIPREDRARVYQWGTLVRSDHRGHHLGAAVKLQNLLALQECYPERTEIHTTNAENNDTMIGINDRLGFRVVEICPEFMLET
ncbi:MAG: GNAT family N-acetyltransferase [Nocardioidaceae bacterium]